MPMKDYVDLHTHTIASGHAYNTINEMIGAAADQGLKIYGITEHAPAMAGSCTVMYFQNLKVMPRERMGMTVLYGAELNILDFDGRVDLPQRTLAQMDLTVASMHTPCYRSGTKAENTRAYLNVMKNPYVNIIGHPDDGRFPVDYRALAEGAKESGVLLEMNNSSLSPHSFRDYSREHYLEMLEYCRLYETPIVLDSDAHVDLDAANHDLAWQLIKEAGFPEQLVVNTRPEMLQDYLNYYRRQ